MTASQDARGGRPVRFGEAIAAGRECLQELRGKAAECEQARVREAKAKRLEAREGGRLLSWR